MISRRALLLVLASYAWLCVPAVAQSPLRPSQAPDKATIERLAAVARLWATIKYFHPYLAYRQIDWDAALIAAIPAVRAAGSDNDYRAAIDRLLAPLADDLTRTIERPATTVPPKDPRAREPIVPAGAFYVVKDGALVVDCARFMEVIFDKGQEAALGSIAANATGNGIVLDCRHASVGTAGSVTEEEYAESLDNLLRQQLPEMLDRPLPLGTYRYREHSGYVPQVDLTTQGYSSGLTTEIPFVVNGKRRDRRAFNFAVIIDDATPDLRELLSGLQAAGRAFVVQDGGKAWPVGTASDVHLVPMPGGFRVQVRIAELISPSGQIDWAPDIRVGPATAEKPDPALEAARDGLRQLGAAASPRASGAGQAVVPRPQWEDPHAEMEFPDAEYRLLALFRFWAAIEYLYPYKNLMDRGWSTALNVFIPRMEASRDAIDYQMAVLELAAWLPDTHARVENADAAQRQRGEFAPPLTVETVEGQTVVVALRNADASTAEKVKVGDIVLAVDDEDIDKLRARIAPLVGASTPQARRRRVDAAVLRGQGAKPARLRLKGADGATREVEVPRSARFESVAFGGRRSNPPVFGILESGYGYIDLDRLTYADGNRAIDAMLDAPALILDMRGYPRGGHVAILGRLSKSRRSVAGPIFRRPVWSGRFLDAPDYRSGPRFTFQQTFPASGERPFRGKVVMLVNEYAVSSAEHVCLVFAELTDVTFVGTPSLGTDGNTTNIVLPGNLVIWFTGEEVRRPDGRQFQRIGIQPHVKADRTIEGVRANRDEVLEAAVNYLKEQSKH